MFFSPAHILWKQKYLFFFPLSFQPLLIFLSKHTELCKQSSKTDPRSNVQYFEAKTHQLQSPSNPRPAVLTFSLPISKNVTQDFQKTDSCFNDNSGCYFQFPFFYFFFLPPWSLFLSPLSADTTQLSKMQFNHSPLLSSHSSLLEFMKK